MSVLGKRLKEAREKKRLTQIEAAKMLGISNGTLSGYERNYRDPDTSTLEKMAELYGVSVDHLLGRSDESIQKEPTKVPTWATSKDKRDFKKMLEEDPEVMFDGVPLDDEDREKIKRVMEAIFWDAKKKNKRKPAQDD